MNIIIGWNDLFDEHVMCNADIYILLDTQAQRNETQ